MMYAQQNAITYLRAAATIAADSESSTKFLSSIFRCTSRICAGVSHARNAAEYTLACSILVPAMSGEPTSAFSGEIAFLSAEAAGNDAGAAAEEASASSSKARASEECPCRAREAMMALNYTACIKQQTSRVSRQLCH